MKKLSFILLAVIFFTAEANPQWVLQTTPSSNALSAISVVNSNVIYAAGDYETIIKTTNGGVNWIKLRENLAGKDYLGIHFINESTGIAVGGLFTPVKIGIISRTTNGGANWTDFTSTDGCFRALHFVNSTTGYLGGWVNSAAISPVLKTTNAGLNWLAAPAFNCYGVEDFHFINSSTGWATGDVSGGQALFKTVNGGYTWTVLSNFGGSVWLCSVFFINENTGWVTGNQSNPWGGLLRKTTNGGLNWTPQVHSNTNELYEIQFINDNTGWVAGDMPNLQKTTNGGTNWFTQSGPGAWWMWDLHFINDNTGWAAGSQGKIFHTTNGGGPVSVRNISTEIPSSFSLSQNYPNPFNNTSNLKFEIANLGHVKLIVYDLMGREIETLVNEELQPGTYEVTFNGSKLNSGVYFYKLVTDGFTETKRMILIK